MNDTGSFDALCDELFNSADDFWGADHSERGRHMRRSHHSPSDEPSGPLFRPSSGRSLETASESERVAPALQDTVATETALLTAPATNVKARVLRQTPKKKSWLRLVGIGSLLLGLLFGWLLVPAPSPTVGVGQKPIKDLLIFDRTLGENPLPDDADRMAAEPDPETWQLLTLVLRQPNDIVEIQLARPQAWIDVFDVEAGGTVPLHLPEVGVMGEAEVLSVDVCPPLAPSPGNVIIGTFKHRATEVINVAIDGAAEPIGCTPNHLFWSEDRHDFVPAGDLHVGEHVRTRSGISQVASITRRGPPEPVYNIEVHGEHVYRIGELGTLVHNNKGHIALGFQDLFRAKGQVSVKPIGESFEALAEFSRGRGIPFWEWERAGLARSKNVWRFMDEGMANAKHIHFNLDGFKNKGSSLRDAVMRGAGPGARKTEYELFQSLKYFRGKTTFYRNGAIVDPTSFFGRFIDNLPNPYAF